MKLAGCFLFSVFYLSVPWVFAQDSDQPSSDSGVLVSSPIHTQVSDQDNTGYNDGNGTSPDQGSSNSWGNHRYRHAAGDAFSQNNTGNSGDHGETSNASTDEIVVKSTNVVMSQITANMKLTQDQISAIQPIIADNIIKVRDFQLSLEKGTIDGKTMYNQRELLTEGENQALSRVLTPDQMKAWVNIQNQ